MRTSPAPDSPARGGGSGRSVGALRVTRAWWPVFLVVLVLAVARSAAVTGDVLWQVRTGLDVLSSGKLPHADAYSWTVAGRSWVPNSWAWDVLAGLTWRAGGVVGLHLLAFASAVVVLAGVAVAAARAGARPWPTAVVLLAGGAVMSGWLSPRPQSSSYVMLLAAVGLARSAASSQGRRRWWSLAGLCLVQVVWVNLHFAALTGPVVAVAVVAGTSLAGGRRGRACLVGRWLPALLAPVAAAAACLVTPYGPQAGWKVVVVANSSVGVIDEWSPPGFGSTAQESALALLVLGVLGLVAALRLRDLGTAAALVVLVAGTVAASRFAPMLTVVALVPLAAWVSRGRAGAYLRSRRAPVGAAAAVVGCVVIAGAAIAPATWFQPLPDASMIEQLPQGCHLLNDYTLGGEVELLRPDVPVAVDGRNDLYGTGTVRQVTWVLGGPAQAASWLRAHDVGCVLVSRDAPLVTTLEGTPGWRLVDQSVDLALLETTGAGTNVPYGK